MDLRFEVAERGGDQVIAVKELHGGSAGPRSRRDFTAVLRRNDFVALIGPNGAGKSSFISTIIGDREPASGEVKIGGSITPAWFRQDLADPPASKVVVRRNPGSSVRCGPEARCRIASAPSASVAMKCSARSAR
jgi:ATP-binding cassette subfamily F protein 3